MFLKKQRYVFFDVSDMFFQWGRKDFLSNKYAVVDKKTDFYPLRCYHVVCLFTTLSIPMILLIVSIANSLF